MKTIIDGTEILSGEILDALALGDPVGLIDDLTALVMMNQRSFAGIIPHVVIEEAGDDELRITDHPVEVGAGEGEPARRGAGCSDAGCARRASPRADH